MSVMNKHSKQKLLLGVKKEKTLDDKISGLTLLAIKPEALGSTTVAAHAHQHILWVHQGLI